MINVIIYDECSKDKRIDVKTLKNIFVNDENNYQITTFYEDNLKFNKIISSDLSKIYVLNIFNSKKGMEIASRIRNYDVGSIIILIANCHKYQSKTFENKLLVLDFICRDKNYIKRLIDDINYASYVINSGKYFVFKYNHILYRIPYNQINYIEKENEIKRCIIHTINNNYYVTSSISHLLNHLDNNFFRAHQSCIVNLDNINEVDLINHTIKFKNNTKTSLFSLKMKKELIKTLGLVEK